MVNPLIKIEKLNVIYFLGRSNEVHALRGINLEIYPGEFIIFFGPSGCGKSTLIYSIAGLETAVQGSIFINGKNLAALTPGELAIFHQKEAGMIFQAYYLISSLNVLNNVILPQMFLGERQEARKKKALDLLEYFGVREQADKLPNELSGGQQQRVAICRSLVNDPAILLADEPVGNLDSTSANDVMNLLKDLNDKQKKTIVLVTHNPSHLHYAHRVFYMKDGAVIEIKVNRPVSEEIGPFIAEAAPAVSREMELLIRTYSSLPSAQAGNLLTPFKAKQIVSEALIGMTSEDVAKMENKVEDLLLRGIDDHEEIFKFLDISEEKGGLGLDQRTARHLAVKIKEIVGEIKSLEEKEANIKKGITTGFSEEVTELRRYLADFCELKIKEFSALKAIDEAISARLENKIDKKEFRNKLDLPLAKGGAGLDKRTAKKLAQRMELLVLGKFK